VSPASEHARPRVLHVLAVSHPHLNGYTVRSRRIVESQERLGDRPVAVTSPFYPGNPAAIEDEVIDGVPHRRVPHPVDARDRLNPPDRLLAMLYRLRRAPRFRALIGGWTEDGVSGYGGEPEGKAARPGAPGRRAGRPPGPLGGIGRRLRRGAAALGVVDRLRFAVERCEEAWLLRRFERAIRRVAAEEGATLIHAHSPFRCALPALGAGRALGLPVVYEVRGVWEESAVASGMFARGDRRYRHWRRAEDAAMARADAVICICETLRREVVGRGVPEERVFVVPNAADPPGKARDGGGAVVEPAAAAETGAPGRAGAPVPTLGYVGSLRTMEGVDELVRGAAEIARRGHEVALLVVGDGPELAELRRLADELGLGDRATFPGAVPHDEVWAHYARIDVFAITRPDTAVTRLVTPLKPLEAMAMGTAVVASDLPALREIVGEGTRGLLYTPGDVDELADQCLRLLGDPDLRRRLGAAGRRWLLDHRTWPAVLAALPSIYAAAGARARVERSSR